MESSLADHGVRKYDYETGRFISCDALWDSLLAINPYSYSLNNPIRFIDYNGLWPGDVFKSRDDAARDFARCYNCMSITLGREMGAAIYSNTVNGEKVYSYTDVRIGFETGVNVNIKVPEGSTREATIHSHAKYYGPMSLVFSKPDKDNANNRKCDNYMVAPNGILSVYYFRSGFIQRVNNNYFTPLFDVDPVYLLKGNM